MTPVPPPERAVWELTWRCNLRCSHCLVEAGPPAPDELDTDAALDLADQLAALGLRAVTLTGGEPLMRKDWSRVAQRLVDHGLAFLLSCNGHLLRPKTVAQLVALGCRRVILSLDGLPATHDRIRRFPEATAKRSSWDEVVAAMERLGPTPIEVEVITAVRAGNLEELPELHQRVKDLGVDIWSVQLAHPTGRFGQAGAPPADMVPKERMPELARFLVGAARDPVLPPMVHPSIGWLSRDEPVLRSSARGARPRFWRGSACGRTMLAIEPDGGVKGCPNQVGAPFVVGNVRDEPLAQIWGDRARWHWLQPAAPAAGGACAPCCLFGHCGGGCPCISVATTGRLFDSPWCLRHLERPPAG